MARRTATSYRRTTVSTDAGAGETVDPQDPAARTVVVEDKSLGLAEALSIATTLMLIAAILVLDAYLGKRYGAGIFF